MDGMPHSASSSNPPTLPPITRVTSTSSDHRYDTQYSHASALHEDRNAPIHRSLHDTDVGFIGGVALQKLRRDAKAQQLASRAETSDRPPTNSAEEPHSHQRSVAPEPVIDGANLTQGKYPAPLSTPADVQQPSTGALPRRQAGTLQLQDSTVSTIIEPSKGKKGLPFLKNPMSTLLARRRNNQNAPDLHPLPLRPPDEEPLPDPRIRGTRVHDFSAPRQRRNVYAAGSVPSLSESDVVRSNEEKRRVGAGATSGESPANGLGNIQQDVDRTLAIETSTPVQSGTNASSDLEARPSVKRLSFAERAAQPRLSTLETRRASKRSPMTSSSIRTARSRNTSLSEISAIPRHMKSTSSRFSFDMAGAAQQEKLLEERHRQREQERVSHETNDFRDSRFDDFDDDAFDYDALMDDDGLEERIPGVNADFDDAPIESSLPEGDENDPENDQENFSGFVFQRSGPTSSLASPYSGGGILATPRDANGNVIGFAMTKDTPSTAHFPPESQHPDAPVDASALRFGAETSSTVAPAPVDDMYYDDGAIGLEDEFAEDLALGPDASDPPFDESLFDLDDTDELGRPVPGAFQQAQSLRRATQRTSVKRESGLTSHMSARSGASQSTAHTSLSADGVTNVGETTGNNAGPLKGDNIMQAPHVPGSQNSTAAYQAALAAAAHRAVATGKFQRCSSPPPATEETIGDNDGFDISTATDLYDDFGYENMDELDFDDDAIIAEANASALANDSDGWYGQEFGFYSAPPNAHGPSHASGSSSAVEYSYSNGGFFGLGGIESLNRSASGRQVSREPNLTPITERSEASNRNSLMSLGFPPLSSSTPALQSPGLAQLVMMADNGDDQMTLSALLRLRSKAWGGSQTSLVSSRDGSPRSERAEPPSGSWAPSAAGFSMGRRASGLSFNNPDSEVASASDSPTMTMSGLAVETWQNAPIPEEQGFYDQQKEQAQWSSGAPDPEGTADTPDVSVPFSANEQQLAAILERSSMEANRQIDAPGVTLSARQSFRRHRHKGSADSISYMKEEEEGGETRWVIERRRTGDSGEVQLLEREVVEGGRI